MDDSTRIATRSNRELLENALMQAGVRKWSGRSCQCPFHDDRHPSAGIYEKDGAWFFKCQVCGAGGDVFDIRAKLSGLNSGQVMSQDHRSANLPPMQPRPPKKPKPIFMTIEALCDQIGRWKDQDSGKPWSLQNCYLYQDPHSNKIDMIVLRCLLPNGRKTFIQAGPAASGYTMEAPAQPWPIYNREKVLAARRVIIVEGEKAADALIEVYDGTDTTATTSPGGAGKAQYANWLMLAGKEVICWPDNDDPTPPNSQGEVIYPKGQGVHHMEEVVRILETLDPAPSIRWIDPTQHDLPPKGDAYDALLPWAKDSVQTRRNIIECILADAFPIGIGASFMRRIEDTLAGRRRCHPLPFRRLTEGSRALMPGTITMLYGAGGTSKTFLLLACLMYWANKEIKTTMYQLEEDRDYYLTRLQAMLEYKSELVDPEWMEANPAATREAAKKHLKVLEYLGSRIHVAPDRMVSMEEMADWVEARAKEKNEIIIIDPITACSGREKPFESDLKFLSRTKTVLRATGSRLIVVTHTKSSTKSGKDAGMAGAEAWFRFSQTVLFLQAFKTRLREVMAPIVGSANENANRAIKIEKARNGAGGGYEVALLFEGDYLQFKEIGVIIEDLKK